MSTAAMRRWFLGSLATAFVVSAWVFAADAQAGRRGENDYERARELHNQRQYVEAAAAFIASYEAGYREDTSAYNAACGLARAGRSDDAFKWLARAHDAGFDLDSYLDDDSDLRSLRGDPRFAALRAQVLNGRTSRHEREGDRAVSRYGSLVAQRAADPHVYGEVGRELLRAGRYDEATRAFLSAAERDDNPASSIYNAACARSLQGKKSEALALLQRAVEAGFADPRHLDEDDDLDAIRDEPGFRPIHALAEELEVPGYPSQGSDRTAQSRREWMTAMPRIAAAVRKHPQLGQAWFNLGFAGIALGHLAQAAPSFQQAIELGYRKPTSMYNVACAHALSGQVDEAFAWLDKALANGFDSWSMLRSDSDLDNLRSDPRFRKLMDAARAHER